MSVRGLIRAADRVTMPWKNGGGITHELVRRGDGPAGFAVRISIAEVSSDGPFSRFPGVDRVILLLEGNGFTLTRDDGVVVRFDRPLAPFSFLGEDAWTCTLTSGPVLDFNVMTDRATTRAAVTIVDPGQVTCTWWLALEAGRVGEVQVARGDLVELDGDAHTTVAGIAVTTRSVTPTPPYGGPTEGPPP